MIFINAVYVYPYSRVHISKATINSLKQLDVIGTKYIVEDGYGMNRSEYLAERGIDTYFITRNVSYPIIII